jgi:hypothetical protein
LTERVYWRQKRFFLLLFAALGKKVEDIRAKISTSTIFGQYQNALDIFSRPYLGSAEKNAFSVEL